MNTHINRLEFLCQIIPPLLNSMDSIDFTYKPSPLQWSKKEILGHLIDSATNNHHRIIRAQFENVPEITYNQNLWNTFGFYQYIPTPQIICFWTAYNLQIVELLKQIPSENQNKLVKINQITCTLHALISDYLQHLEHHLKQITEY